MTDNKLWSIYALTQMTNNIGRLGPRAFTLFADWTDRIAGGELPASRPTRPQGVERNVVVTLWDWAGAHDYLHDEISTDKRKPTNANGRNAWVDQFDTFGLGKNVPIATGNANEALLAFVQGQWVLLRVPNPMGFYTKWMDGRIDDASAGWKGKGLFATYSTRASFHVEGGKGTTRKVVQFQLRPDPLAR